MNVVHLQGIGKVTGTTVAELKVGMIVMFNYGYTAEVTAITLNASGKTAKVTMYSHTNKRFNILDGYYNESRQPMNNATLLTNKAIRISKKLLSHLEPSVAQAMVQVQQQATQE